MSWTADETTWTVDDSFLHTADGAENGTRAVVPAARTFTTATPVYQFVTTTPIHTFTAT